MTRPELQHFMSAFALFCGTNDLIPSSVGIESVAFSRTHLIGYYSGEGSVHCREYGLDSCIMIYHDEFLSKYRIRIISKPVTKEYIKLIKLIKAVIEDKYLLKLHRTVFKDVHEAFKAVLGVIAVEDEIIVNI